MRLIGGASRFVGRSEQLSDFAQLVESARSGSPVVAVVGGDAGIGKSTFVQEAATRCGVEMLLGRCAQIGRQPLPLAPIVDLVRQIARLCLSRIGCIPCEL
jgi:predicted ATPase